MMYLFSRDSLAVASVLAVVGVGCADIQAADQSAETDTVEQVATPTAPTTSTAPTPATAPDPNAITFGDVVARGAGCLPGTWVKSISNDGLAFTLLFSAFELTTSPEKPAPQSLNCTLQIKVNTPAGASFAVSKFSYSGFALLDEGVIAEQSASYNFFGSIATDIRTKTSRFTGPYDSEYELVDEVKNLDWSLCGDTRTLQVTTNIALQNSPKANGYINTHSIDSNIGDTTILEKPKLEIQLAQRVCPKK